MNFSKMENYTMCLSGQHLYPFSLRKNMDTKIFSNEYAYLNITYKSTLEGQTFFVLFFQTNHN